MLAQYPRKYKYATQEYDSADIYSNWINGNENTNRDKLSLLLDAESRNALFFAQESYGMEIDSLVIEKQKLSGINKGLKAEASALRKINISYSDSIRSKNIELLKLSEETKYYDSLAKANKETSDKYSNKASEAQARAKEFQEESLKSMMLIWFNLSASLKTIQIHFSFRRGG